MDAKKIRIFQPFIDGILKYDCSRCKDNCCIRDGWIIMNEREWNVISNAYPFIKYFVTSKKRGIKKKNFIVRVKRYPPCWFLDTDGLCSLQRRYGYGLKPLICRTHPYYVLRCNNEYLISPLNECNSSLMVVKKIVKDKRLSEEKRRILRNAKELIEGRVFDERIKWPRARLSLEKRIFQESKRYLDKTNYIGFAIRQLALTYKGVSVEEIKKQLLKKVDLWQQFLKMEEVDINNRKITYELTAITCLLRAKEHKLNEKIIALTLLALYILILLFSQLNKNQKNYVSTYTKMLDLAKKLIFLIDNQKTKAKLLSYMGKRGKKRLALVKGYSLAGLAEKLHLTIDKRMMFIYSELEPHKTRGRTK